MGQKWLRVIHSTHNTLNIASKTQRNPPIIHSLPPFSSNHSRNKRPKMAHRERTFIMVKPDGVQRGLIGEIIQRFERRGYKLVAMKFMQADEKLLQQHYSDLAGRPFFNGLVKFMQSGPVVPMVWEGTNVVLTGRDMIGATNPLESKPGTIRGDLCVQVGRNIVHGSDSVASAEKEIALWFKDSELVSWVPQIEPCVYE